MVDTMLLPLLRSLSHTQWRSHGTHAHKQPRHWWPSPPPNLDASLQPSLLPFHGRRRRRRTAEHWKVRIMIDIFDVHKNQQPQHRHLEFVPEFKFRIQFLFILRHVHKCTCNFVLFHLFCMTVYTGKLCFGTLKLRSRWRYRKFRFISPAHARIISSACNN